MNYIVLGNPWVWLCGVIALTLMALVRWQAHLLLTDGLHNRILLLKKPWLVERPSFGFLWWVTMAVYMLFLFLATIQWFALAGAVIKLLYWGSVALFVKDAKRRRRGQWRWR